MAASGGVGTGMADIDGGLLVSAQWLAERLRAAATTQRRRVVPVDASWHMPASKRSARVEFHSVARIPVGALVVRS